MSLPEDPIESLERALATASKDWSESKDDAWIYGIILGWDKESLQELQELHRWNDEAVARLERLHQKFKTIKGTQGYAA